MLRVMEPTTPERALLEVCQVFEVTVDASFINEPALEEDDEPMAEDTGSVAHDAETTDTTTSQV